MNIAIVHDFLNQYGGAEKVVEVLHKMYPDAPIYTSIYDREHMPASFKDMDIRVSFMQKLPGIFKHFKKYLILYHAAFEMLNLSEYDVVISSSSAFSKCIRLKEGTCHICYCHTPPRFIWRYEDYIKREDVHGIILKLLPYVIKYLKKIDINSARHVDYFIANSKNIAKRIKDIYNKEAAVIYPPVEVEKFSLGKVVEDYYLVVSRLREYKRIDVAVKAFNELGLPLKVIGSGTDKAKLQDMAKDNIEFLGRLDDERLSAYYRGAKALVYTGEEDFGIIPVEAQASGRPVIAYGAGGALETVVDGETGVFFKEQQALSLVKAVKDFKELSFNPENIRVHALRFDEEHFIKNMKSFIERKYKEYNHD
jgi:glycosyltransferase involved in cell wall biosynthesis